MEYSGGVVPSPSQGVAFTEAALSRDVGEQPAGTCKEAVDRAALVASGKGRRVSGKGEGKGKEAADGAAAEAAAGGRRGGIDPIGSDGAAKIPLRTIVDALMPTARVLVDMNHSGESGLGTVRSPCPPRLLLLGRGHFAVLLALPDRAPACLRLVMPLPPTASRSSVRL